MPLHDLSPAFVVNRYHSPYGVHNQTIPTRAWSPPTGTNLFGLFTNWNDVQIDARDMIEDLVTAMADLQPSTVSWDGFTIYTKADADSDALPVASDVLAIAGTSVLAGWYAANQWTFNALDTAFLPAKLVVIEASSGGDFGRVLPGVYTAEQQAVIDLWTDADNAWASRAGNRVNTVRNITKDLNDKLRKEYNIG